MLEGLDGGRFFQAFLAIVLCGTWSLQGTLRESAATCSAGPAATAGKPAGGLAFSLKADRYVVDVANGQSGAIRLKYTFENVSRQSFRLDEWYPVTSAMSFVVIEPNGTRKNFQLAIPYKKREARTASDFVLLNPGKRYVLERETDVGLRVDAPGDRAPRAERAEYWTYRLSGPGLYRIQATFRREPGSERIAGRGAKLWTGEVMSNEIVVNVRSDAEH